MSRSILTNEDHRAIADVLDSKSARFTDLIQKAGLDPKVDLRHMPLRNIVLQPDENLSGFDFTGADLSGANFRRADLTDVNLNEAFLFNTDLRGAALKSECLSSDQLEMALTGQLPEALKYGPNRLWPEDLFEEILAILDACDDWDALFKEAREQSRKHRYRLSEQLYRCCLDWSSHAFGSTAQKTLTAESNLANILLTLGCLPESEVRSRAVVANREKIIGRDADPTLVSRSVLISAILHQGRAEEAEAAFRKLLFDRDKISGKDDESTLKARAYIARCDMSQGRIAEAEIAYRELLADCERVLGTDYMFLGHIRLHLAVAALERGAAEEVKDVLPPWSLHEDPRQIARRHLIEGFLADLVGDAETAEKHLDAAENTLAQFEPQNIERREIAHYRKTRVAGAKGGTTLWMINKS